MPVLDGDDRVVGIVLREDLPTGNYIRSYLVLDFSIHKLRLYGTEAEYCSDLSQVTHDVEINCQYITKVGGRSSTRPKALNSLEIVTTGGSHFLSLDSVEEREEWAESIRKASMMQCSAKQVVSFIQQKKDISYQTKIVGGVVHRVPIQTGDNNTSGNGANATGADLKGVGQVGGASGGMKRAIGLPRIVKAGHAIKLGYVRKNWKKRFFILTESCLGYYKTIDELEPIKTIPVAEVSSVSPCQEANMFQVVTPTRTFYLKAESALDLEDWLKCFSDLLSTFSPQYGSPYTYEDQIPMLEEQVQTLSLVSSEDDDEVKFGTLV